MKAAASTSGGALPRTKVPKIVAIVWLDAVAGAGWTHHDDAGEPHEVYSVGFLVRRSRAGVTIATSVSGGEHNGSMTIPRGMIQRMTYL